MGHRLLQLYADRLCIGEAAGTAVGLAAKAGCKVRGVSVSQLQRTLKQNGGFIGI